MASDIKTIPFNMMTDAQVIAIGSNTMAGALSLLQATQARNGRSPGSQCSQDSSNNKDYLDTSDKRLTDAEQRLFDGFEGVHVKYHTRPWNCPWHSAPLPATMDSSQGSSLLVPATNDYRHCASMSLDYLTIVRGLDGSPAASGVGVRRMPSPQSRMHTAYYNPANEPDAEAFPATSRKFWVRLRGND